MNRRSSRFGRWPSSSKNTILLFISLLPVLALLLPDTLRNTFGDLYQASLFVAIRNVYDHLLGRLPFPSFYWLLALWISFLLFPLFRRARRVRRKLANLAFRIIFVFGCFYWLWGFNYMAASPQDRMGLQRSKISIDHLENAFCRELDLINYARPKTIRFDKISIENEVRENVRLVLENAGITTAGRPRVRTLKPHGVLLRLATAGVYMPFVGEGQIDGGMHQIVQPFTMAHEMSHAFGVGHEGSCNFVAYLAGLNSPDPLFSFSVHISYWRYLAAEIKKLDPERYKRLWKEVGPEIKRDINEINEYYNRYPDLIPLARSPVYDQYLKMQGMKEGLGTYLQIISWVEDWYGRYGKDKTGGI